MDSRHFSHFIIGVYNNDYIALATDVFPKGVLEDTRWGLGWEGRFAAPR